MKWLSRLIVCVLLFSFLNVQAGVVYTDAELKTAGAEWTKVKNRWQKVEAHYNKKIDYIKGRKDLSPAKKQKMIASEKTILRRKSNKLAVQRDKIQQMLINETNARVKGSTKASQKIQQTAGTKLGDSGHRGMKGDLDAGGGVVATKKLKDVAGEMGLDVKITEKPGTIEFEGDFEFTVNKTGIDPKPGDAFHQVKTSVDARNKETYVSESMKQRDINGKVVKQQAGADYVTVQDHKKKAMKGLLSDGNGLVKNPDAMQGMAKGTTKALGDAKLDDDTLSKILKQRGIKKTPAEFREHLQSIKEQKIIIKDPVEAQKMRDVADDVFNAAENKTRAQAKTEMADLKQRIADAKARGDVDEVRRLSNEYVDSRVKMEETKLANEEKRRKGNVEPDADGKKTKTGDPDAEGKKAKTDDPDADGKKAKTDDPDADGKKSKTGDPDADGKKSKIGEPDADSRKPKAGDADADSRKPKTGDTDVDGRKPRTGDPDVDGRKPRINEPDGGPRKPGIDPDGIPGKVRVGAPDAPPPGKWKTRIVKARTVVNKVYPIVTTITDIGQASQVLEDYVAGKIDTKEAAIRMAEQTPIGGLISAGRKVTQSSEDWWAATKWTAQANRQNRVVYYQQWYIRLVKSGVDKETARSLVGDAMITGDDSGLDSQALTQKMNGKSFERPELIVETVVADDNVFERTWEVGKGIVVGTYDGVKYIVTAPYRVVEAWGQGELKEAELESASKTRIALAKTRMYRLLRASGITRQFALIAVNDYFDNGDKDMLNKALEMVKKYPHMLKKWREESKRLLGARTRIKDWYCTNRPEVKSDVAVPSVVKAKR